MLAGRLFRWSHRRRLVDGDGVDPWLSLIIVLLLGGVLGNCVAVFMPGR
jgi:hypothetical protein